MAESVCTACKQCHRAVYVEHLDRDGFCCFCTTQPETIPQSEATSARQATGKQTRPGEENFTLKKQGEED